MSNIKKNKYTFHPYIASTYTHVHQWIADKMPPNNYKALKRKNIRDKINKLLSKQTFLSAASQYYLLFPAHFFKVTYTLENIVGFDNLLNWLQYNSRICLIDIGCGAGSASMAFIDRILYLQENDRLTHPIDVFFVGVDPNQYAIALYNQSMLQLQSKIKERNINIDYEIIPRGDLEAINQLMETLNKKRETWQQPYLPHVFVMQVNVVSPFSKRYENTQSEYETLKDLGLDLNKLGKAHEAFGREEVLAYKQILEKVAIDRMHIITVGTQDWENRVDEMAQAIDQEFGDDSHSVKRLGEGTYTVYYNLPDSCYWKEQKNTSEYFSKFHVDISTIANIKLNDDKDWNNVKSEENLKLAWVRSRHYLLEQTLVDEVEIRLFESNLEVNLIRLQQQLVAYVEDVIQIDDRISYQFPKNLSNTRPLGLSRIDEEILSTAIIQQLGEKVVGLMNRSYAYRFSRNYYGGRNTEYLYEYWFDAYQKYITHAQNEAQKHEECIILRVDIKSFYTRIVQDQLLQITTERLSKSERVQWLLRLLLYNDIDGHEAGVGIVQGNIGSGFYANLYLINLDAYFSSNNEWALSFIDMLMI